MSDAAQVAEAETVGPPMPYALFQIGPSNNLSS